jgi:hypothetical protein
VLATAGEVIEQLFGAFISWYTCTLPVLCCTEASREISSRSSSLNAATALRRGAVAIPPWRATIRWIPVKFLLSSAREMANTLCPFFQRSHSSAFCSAVNHVRDVIMCHLLIQQDQKLLH